MKRTKQSTFAKRERQEPVTGFDPGASETRAHTSGPWAVSDDGDVTLIVHAPKDEVDIARMSNDCEMFSEIRANAHIIAAAPAMYTSGKLSLDVMERVASELEQLGNEPLRSLLRSAIIEQKAALTQAEGRKNDYV